MRLFWVGLLIGALGGFTIAFLWLGRHGEEGSTTSASLDAGSGDAGPRARKKKKRKRRRHRQKPGAPPGEMEEVEEEVEEDDEDGRPVVLSEAERKLAWRGPAVELPAKSVDFSGDGDGGRSLSAGEIDSGIQPARGRLSACVGAARGDAPLSADVTVKFLVDGRGRAGAMRVRAPVYLLDHGLHDCLQNALSGMRFTATGAHTVVTLPLELR